MQEGLLCPILPLKWHDPIRKKKELCTSAFGSIAPVSIEINGGYIRMLIVDSALDECPL
jgi:hypothetical protein